MRDVFNQNDASRILKIPLSFSDQDDKWLWLEDCKGEYTVKSGYRVLSRNLPQRLGEFSDFKWKKLWNLAVPPKNEIFYVESHA